MSPRARKWIEEFFALPLNEQADVLEAIMRAKDLGSELGAELERRVRILRDGTALVHDWADVEREPDGTANR